MIQKLQFILLTLYLLSLRSESAPTNAETVEEITSGIDSLIDRGRSEIHDHMKKPSLDREAPEVIVEAPELDTPSPEQKPQVEQSEVPMQVNNDQQLIDFLREYFKEQSRHSDNKPIKKFLPKLDELLSYLRQNDAESFEAMRRLFGKHAKPRHDELTDQSDSKQPTNSSNNGGNAFSTVVLCIVIFVLLVLLLALILPHTQRSLRGKFRKVKCTKMEPNDEGKRVCIDVPSSTEVRESY